MVVIWPVFYEVTPGVNVVADSVRDSITVAEPVAAIPGTAPPGLKVYTINEQLWIKCDEANVLKYVRIYDITGRLIEEQNLSSSTSIPMNGYSDGIYLAEVTLTNNQRITYKLFSGH